MKKKTLSLILSIFFFFALVVVSLCVFKNSKNFYIDLDQIWLKPDFQNYYELIPEDRTLKLYIEHSKKRYSTNFAGLYSRFDASRLSLATTLDEEMSNLLSTANFHWQTDENEDSKSHIFFCENNTLVFYCEKANNIEQFQYSFDDNKLTIYIDNVTKDVYKCVFFHPDNKSNPQDSSHSISDNDESSNNIDVGAADNEFLSWLREQLRDSSFNFSATLALFLFALLYFVLFINFGYPNKLKAKLYPKSHNWFSNNDPADIYISVSYTKKGTHNKNNLIDSIIPQLLDKRNSYAIIGKAGEGKSFAISKIAQDLLYLSRLSNLLHDRKTYLKAKKAIPIILCFHSCCLCKNCDELINCIGQEICSLAGVKLPFLVKPMSKYYEVSVRRYLKSGKLVIMFDGYDEIIDTDTRLYFSNVLSEFIQIYNKCSYIITSRPQIYEKESFGIIDQDNVFSLVTLSKEQIHDFLFKLTYPNNKSATELYHSIINSVQLESVVTNPLLLTMIAHTYCSSSFSLTGSKLGLYQQCTYCLLEKWEQNKLSFFRIKRRYNTLDDYSVKQDLLKLLAFHLYKNETLAITESKVLELWSNHKSEKYYYHGKAKRVLDDIIEQSWIIEKTEANSIRFCHRSFYEYFTALYLLDHGYSQKRLYKNIHNEYNIVFFFLCLYNEKTVADFLMTAKEYPKLYQEILIERKIKNKNAVMSAVSAILGEIDFSNESQMVALGHIAKRYSYVSDMVSKSVKIALSTETEPAKVVNSILCLLVFYKKSDFVSIFKQYADKINLSDLTSFAGEEINDFAKEIILYLNKPSRVEFVEKLAKTYRFEAIFNIFRYVSSCKDLALAGFLYMFSDPHIIQMLRIKKFEKYLTPIQVNKAHDLQTKYGWKNSQLTKEDVTCLYQLLYLLKEQISKGFMLNAEILDHRCAFLLCYMISEETSTVYQELISNNDINFESSFEMAFHWSQYKRSVFSRKEHSLHSESELNSWIIKSEFILLIFHMALYIFYFVKLFNILITGWHSNYMFSDNFRFISFNSAYLMLLGAVFVVDWIANRLLDRFNHGVTYQLFVLSTALLILNAYMCLVVNAILRLSTAIILLFVGFMEILKHRNNYPALRKPLYNIIVQYLLQ